jgi:hypothetical protein
MLELVPVGPLPTAFRRNLSDSQTGSSKGHPRAAPRTNLSDNQTSSPRARCEGSNSNRFNPEEPSAEGERDGRCGRTRPNGGTRTETRGPRPVSPNSWAHVLAPMSLESRTISKDFVDTPPSPRRRRTSREFDVGVAATGIHRTRPSATAHHSRMRPHGKPPLEGCPVMGIFTVLLLSREDGPS